LTTPRHTRNSFAPKILPATYCRSRITSHFFSNLMIPTDQQPGGVGGVSLFHSFRERAILVSTLALTLIFSTGLASAQAQRGTLVHEETIRVSPASDAAKLGEAGRGHELVIIETSRDWTHVEAILREPKKDADEDDPESEGKTITGWVSSHALVNLTTPNGDKIIFGEAADSEDEASRRRGRRDAAQDALRLYFRVYDLFPTSPLAAEGLYRAADIRWQIERSDVLTRPSAREKDSYMRGQIDEAWMKLVIKKFPGTKWADLAAFRRSALIEIYKTEANGKKSEESKTRALAIAQKIVSQYSQSDWSLRAQRLIFYIQQGVPTFGNTTD